MKKLLLMFSALSLLCGCGGGSQAQKMSVSLTPSAQTSIDQGQALNFSAKVADDTSGDGVTWSMSGTSCSGTACGTFSNKTTSAATYNAPTSVSANMTVKVSATSVADTTKTMSSNVVLSPAPSITTTSLASGTAGTAYSATLQASGGAGTLTWSLASGSTLPAGLSLSSSGAISGTPTSPEVSNFTVKVTDSSGAQGGRLSATQQLSITIKPAPLTITTTSLSNGVVGIAYSASLSASGGTGTISWNVSSGSLPAGLNLSASGAISGTPTAAGAAPFTVTAADSGTPQQTSNQSLSITINPQLTITTTTLPNGVVSAAYSASLQSSGGVGTITWSVTSGTLPAGLSMNSSGAISGTPTTAIASSFTVAAKDSGTPQQTVQQALSITVYAGLTITTTSLPNGTVNSAYSVTLHSGGGVGTITWSVSQGSLPPGLSLSSSGTISGSPTTAGTTNFTISASDSGTPQQTKTQGLSITINPPLSITTTALPSGTVATAYSQNIQTSGGTLPITWSVPANTLPPGLTLQGNASGVGVVSGIPTAVGSYTFTVTATDSSSPQQSVNQQLTIVINNVPLSVTTTTLPNAAVGTAYNQPLQASGGTPPYTWTVATGSTLPAWLTLSGSGTSWTLSGTPTAAATSNFSLTVTDSSVPPQSKTTALSITIVSASACGSGNEKALKGQYAFDLIGYTADGFLGAVGSFTADGNGNITAGTVDANGAQVSGNGVGVQSGSITASGSSYTLGSDNRGCATIQTLFYTFTTRFAISPTPAGAAQGTIQEFEPAPVNYIASGQIFQQHVPAAVPNGVWVYWQTGVYYGWRVAIVGTKTASGGNITAGEYDSNFEGSVHNYSGITGTYTTPDPTTGRYTVATTLSGVTLNRAAYLVSGTQELEITTSGASTTILVGYVQLQSGSLTLSGNLASYGSGAGIGVGTVTQFATLNATGSSYTANIYEDDGGTWATPSPSTPSCAYTIDSHGRVATSGTNCGTSYSNSTWSYPPVFYLTGPNTGFMLGTDKNAMLGQLVPQSATSITAGTYYFGTQEVPLEGVHETLTGVATITSDGDVTGTEDSSAGQQGNQPLSVTLTVNPDGTFSTSNNPGIITGLVVSGSQLIQVDSQSSWPTILVIKMIPTP